MRQNASYARRGGLISAIPLVWQSTNTRTCREVYILDRISGNYSTAKPSYFCVDGKDPRGLVLRLLSLMRWVFGGFMKSKKTKQTTIRSVLITPSIKQSITRHMNAWAKAKKLEIKDIEKIP